MIFTRCVIPVVAAHVKLCFREPQDSAQSFGGHRDFKFRGPLCPPKLCAETLVRRTHSMVHGPDARPLLEVEALHEPARICKDKFVLHMRHELVRRVQGTKFHLEKFSPQR